MTIISTLRRGGFALVAWAWLCAAAPAVAASAADNYPNHPIKLIVPFAPGGPTDFACRLMAQRLAEQIGQAVAVDNRAGAGGTIGAQAAATSPNDGYTLFCASTSTMAIAPGMYDKLPYDPVRSFVPISMIAKSPLSLAVSPKLNVKSVDELIKLARARPGALHFGSAGVGTPPHLAAELFKSITGTDIVHIPYKGASLAMNDVLAGQIEMMFESPATLGPFVRSGQVVGLLVTSTERSSSLPEVPSAKEAGVPDLQVSSWNGLVAPVGTPPEIIDKLGRLIQQDLARDDVKAALTKVGLEASGGTSAEFAGFIQAELARWTPITRNFKP